ncbi:ATP-dependent helicase HrpB [Pedomonas mirosovicensis]|uniref:ATP-dependent helicase HrpB n=1 Tax=Pedomonas mirosovicensis TaxID=2908641 RepID=UPI00216985F3|nr:ATP-dependent helicase HrpB [Pedomonas mirosovicensis]MCH8685519.1 ATP-dependent helicase HrpB [Pedomonas mirosovicensis]
MTSLPIDAVLPELTAALRAHANAVLVAPPGAGKTTRVPLVLMNEPWARDGKILVLSPRRLAARAAATRMAETLGEAVGQTVGYRVRLESRVNAKTRIEVVTEGVFTRLVQDNPELPGISAVLFDEFHERSLDADLGLALALEAQGVLRPDVRLVPMSATLDGARIANLLGDAPVIHSEGRSYPVETRYLGRDAAVHMETQVAKAIRAALREETGSILVFLPGAAEINRVATLLRDEGVPGDTDVHTLYGAMEAGAQRAAIAPAEKGRRKVVLATSIAETSLTIEGVRVVIDSGLARKPKYEPGTGLTRLVTERASQAAVTQRAGRAGRTAPGVAWRLWEEGQTRALPPFDRPEILEADLSGLALDLALWGVSDPNQLTWLDPPPAAAYAEARELLAELDAIDATGKVTPHGARLAKLPLAPRLAHMVVMAAEEGPEQGLGLLAAEIAVLLGEQGLGGNDVDLRHRLSRWRRESGKRAEQARQMARRWAKMVGADDTPADPEQAGRVLALAYPDRVAIARPGQRGSFVLANGRGGQLDPADSLAGEAGLAVAVVTGAADRARILLAAPLDPAELPGLFPGHVAESTDVRFDANSGALRARQIRRFGKLVLGETPLPKPAPEVVMEAWRGVFQREGLARLPWTGAQARLRERVAFMRAADPDNWPDLSDDALMVQFDDGLGPMLSTKMRLSKITPDDLDGVIAAFLPWDLKRRLEDLVPDRMSTPAGTSHAIDYGASGGPAVEVRVQELFGLTRHPSVAGGRVPLTLVLLSPAHRPIQTTKDLPGFWQGSWAQVKAEMKGRYPKHPWPDDPAAAPPTTRAKPRGT